MVVEEEVAKALEEEEATAEEVELRRSTSEQPVFDPTSGH